MIEKKGLVFGILFIFILASVITFNLVSSQDVSYCAEKTVDGAKCQNVPLSEVDEDFRYAPTSCASTSYCKLGTCVDTSEGICMGNSPKSVCEEDESGVWYDESSDDLPVCQTGCCLMGEQAAFVTQARCQKLASDYGLKIEFRGDIKDEVSCVAAATPNAKGACVYETDAGRTCKMATKSECNELDKESVNFYEGFLCSNPDLGADCGMTKKTTCVEGKDDVYFIDSCGNKANVYDSNKINDVNYWSYLPGFRGVEISEGDDNGNINNEKNGNCDYLLGSTCGPDSESSQNAEYGDYICRDLSCTWEGETYNHGETWCSNSVRELGENGGISGSEFKDFDKEGNNPGDKDYRLVCYDGEVTIEPCAGYRQEVCVEGGDSNFKYASCKVNRWQDCVQQLSKDDCENEFQRDCTWIEGVTLAKTEDKNTVYVYDSDLEKLVKKEIDEDYEEYGDTVLSGEKASCVPKYTPGFNFWEEDSDSSSICSIASTQCFVKYEDPALSSQRVVTSSKGMELFFGRGKSAEKQGQIICLDDDGNLVETWADEISNSCLALGDCGISENYVGKDGYYERDDLFTIVSSEDED